MTNKQQFLDPIGSICKLILLCFSPSGTKIRIINHGIELIEPSTIFGVGLN